MAQNSYGEWRSMAEAPRDGTRVLVMLRASEQGPAEVDVARWGRAKSRGECWMAAGIRSTTGRSPTVMASLPAGCRCPARRRACGPRTSRCWRNGASGSPGERPAGPGSRRRRVPPPRPAGAPTGARRRRRCTRARPYGAGRRPAWRAGPDRTAGAARRPRRPGIAMTTNRPLSLVDDLSPGRRCPGWRRPAGPPPPPRRSRAACPRLAPARPGRPSRMSSRGTSARSPRKRRRRSRPSSRLSARNSSAYSGMKASGPPITRNAPRGRCGPRSRPPRMKSSTRFLRSRRPTQPTTSASSASLHLGADGSAVAGSNSLRSTMTGDLQRVRLGAPASARPPRRGSRRKRRHSARSGPSARPAPRTPGRHARSAAAASRGMRSSAG